MNKCVYFLSDFHLGAKYLNNPQENEKRIVRFLDSIKDKAHEIYLLGDILDYWYEYRFVVPKGFIRFFGKLAELSDSGIKIYWFIGNHDIWIYDYLPLELGVEVIDGVLTKNILGKRFFLNHGDAVGKRKASFRLIRWLFRNKFCQTVYSMLPSRLTIPFAYNWSNHSRANESSSESANVERYKANLIDFVKDYSASHSDIDYFVFGHLHIAADVVISEKSKCVLLGDWIDKFTYAIFDGEQLEIKYYKEV